MIAGASIDMADPAVLLPAFKFVLFLSAGMCGWYLGRWLKP